VSEYQDKTARTQRENESLKRRLQELQDKLLQDDAGKKWTKDFLLKLIRIDNLA